MTSTLAEGARLTGHSGNGEIGTPQELYDWLDRRFRFTYDAAASHENAKAYLYSTVDGTYTRSPGSPRLVADTDGLTKSWTNERVFVNPEYSTAIMRAFIEKAIEERNYVECAVLLVKFDPSTVTGRLLMNTLYFDLEPLSRIRYEGMKNAATFPSVIAKVKPDPWSRGRS